MTQVMPGADNTECKLYQFKLTEQQLNP